MNHELIRYTSGEVVPSRTERSVARRAQRVYDDVRLRALAADGAVALAGRMMDSMARLDEKRRSLSHPEDSLLNDMLMSIQMDAIKELRKIQNGEQRPPRDPWRL